MILTAGKLTKYCFYFFTQSSLQEIQNDNDDQLKHLKHSVNLSICNYYKYFIDPIKDAVRRIEIESKTGMVHNKHEPKHDFY